MRPLISFANVEGLLLSPSAARGVVLGGFPTPERPSRSRWLVMFAGGVVVVTFHINIIVCIRHFTGAGIRFIHRIKSKCYKPVRHLHHYLLKSRLRLHYQCKPRRRHIHHQCNPYRLKRPR